MVRKAIIILILAISVGVGGAASTEAAQTGRLVCVGSGSIITTAGNLPTAGVSQVIGALTSANGGNYVSGTYTNNTQGLVCSYTLLGGAGNSFFTNAANGTGTATQTWVPVATNSATCSPQFVAHFTLAYGVNADTAVETDPTIVFWAPVTRSKSSHPATPHRSRPQGLPPSGAALFVFASAFADQSPFVLTVL